MSLDVVDSIAHDVELGTLLKPPNDQSVHVWDSAFMLLDIPGRLKWDPAQDLCSCNVLITVSNNVR